MTNHEQRLRERGEAYQRAREEADRIIAGPRDELVAAAREAYADGVKKASIHRWMGHVWSDTWIDKILKGVQRKQSATEPTDS
ncbi:hypothetical protein [Verrucosispora sp. WMMC514]|uniref:hypothetical protein n=1 Tax=Verrucosispora sp. WMMC514 TaxID=3015156 RepID=UPI00248BECF7|nr:hypothetical protein [Verrucosispora sp. WMMC514]WBB94118.1 hypothetical protein O7597_14815 [Verrucosispora sp. WMMC514]